MRYLLLFLTILHFIGFVVATFETQIHLAIFCLVLSVIYLIGFVYFETNKTLHT